MTWLSIPVALRDSLLHAIESALETDSEFTIMRLRQLVLVVDSTAADLDVFGQALEELKSRCRVCERIDSKSGLLFYSLSRAA